VEGVEYKNYTFPRDRRYSEKHAWIKRLEANRARIGITDYAQSKLKSIVFVEPPEVGREYPRGELLATIESIKSIGEVYAPLDCKVVAYNEELDDEPGLINRDPYNRGWIVEVEVKQPDEIDDLLTAEEYVERVVKKED